MRRFDQFKIDDASVMYNVTENGHLCTDNDHIDLKVEDDCRDSMTYLQYLSIDVKYKMAVNMSDRPKGCIVRPFGMYWNMHPVGSRHLETKSVCRVGK